jgi:hypothetical protein
MMTVHHTLVIILSCILLALAIGKELEPLGR